MASVSVREGLLMAIRINQASDRVHRSDTFPDPAITGLSFSGYLFLVNDRNENSTYHRLSSSGNATVVTLATSVTGLGINYFTPGGTVTSSVINSVGQWVAVGYTLQGTTCNLYVKPLGENTVVDSGTVSQAVPDHYCVGGRHQTESLEWADERVAYHRVWAGILTQNEFEAEWEAVEAVRTIGLWADWPLEIDLSDISGNNRPLIQGATQYTIEDNPPIVTTPDLTKVREFLSFPQDDYTFTPDNPGRTKGFFLYPGYDFTPTFIPDSLVTALATYLEEQGYGIYIPNGEGAINKDAIGISIDDMPTQPLKVIVVTQYAGPESNSWDNWDEPRIQIKVRGIDDPSFSRDLCESIYKLFHGLGPFTIGYMRIQLIIGLNSGANYMGKDNSGHPRHVTNFQVTVRRTDG